MTFPANQTVQNSTFSLDFVSIDPSCKNGKMARKSSENYVVKTYSYRPSNHRRFKKSKDNLVKNLLKDLML